ncbi:MAG TPA: hypothetical protein PLI09_17880 [Candidatus Hydrogenedentes bacterium]|nr:hypothetical protein [Candidatus Hydrogenedentota bacterium]
MKKMQFGDYLRKSASASPIRYWMGGLALLAVVSILDFITGYEFPFLVFYFPAVGVVAWSGKRRFAFGMALACAGVWFVVDLVTHHPYASEFSRYWTALIWLLAFFSLAMLVLEIRWLFDEDEVLNRQLRTALDEVRELKGLLPICAACKKIRDDEGYWHEIDGYIRSRSKVEFSHGICPDCYKKLYPEYGTKEHNNNPLNP